MRFNCPNCGCFLEETGTQGADSKTHKLFVCNRCEFYAHENDERYEILVRKQKAKKKFDLIEAEIAIKQEIGAL